MKFNFLTHYHLFLIIISNACYFKLFETLLEDESTPKSNLLYLSELQNHHYLDDSASLDYTSICEKLDFHRKSYGVKTRSLCSFSVTCRHPSQTILLSPGNALQSYCQSIPPISPDALILATGFGSVHTKLKSTLDSSQIETTVVPITWNEEDKNLNLNFCALDDISSVQNKINHEGYGSRFPTIHTRVTFTVLISNVSSKKKKISNLFLHLKFLPSREQVENEKLATTLTKCFKHDQVIFLKGKNALKPKEATFVSFAVSIDHTTETLSTDQFQFMIGCQNHFTECNLKYYRVCTQLVCGAMTKNQFSLLSALKFGFNNQLNLEPLPSLPISDLDSISSEISATPIEEPPVSSQLIPHFSDKTHYKDISSIFVS
jgi:hypothetical protein